MVSIAVPTSHFSQMQIHHQGQGLRPVKLYSHYGHYDCNKFCCIAEQDQSGLVCRQIVWCIMVGTHFPALFFHFVPNSPTISTQSTCSDSP